jgi:ABC-type nitrate/sulfonate/bicarbonate transport system substrate-binding protein
MPVGKDADRQAALRGGSVDAAILGSTVEPELANKGFNSLVNLADAKTQGYTGLALNIPDTFREKYPNTTLALTALYQWGVHDWMHNDADKSTKIWADVSEEPLDQAKQEIAILKAINWTPIDGRCDTATFEFQKSVLTATNKSLDSVDPKSVCTDEYVDKLKEMGFQKTLGVTGY